MNELNMLPAVGSRRQPRDINGALFVILCVIWGTTWIATKAGISDVPPLLFAATRFIAAGATFLAWHRVREGSVMIERDDILRTASVSVLMVTLCYGPLFWGMLYVNSGT